MSGQEISTLDVLCTKCGHLWAAADLPMEVNELVSLCGRIECPVCAAKLKDLVVKATQRKE